MNANEKALQAELVERARWLANTLASTGREEDAPGEIIALGSVMMEQVRATLNASAEALAALAEAAAVPPDVAGVEPVAWRWRPQGGSVWVVWEAKPVPGDNLAEDAVVEIEPLYSADALASLAARLEEVERQNARLNDMLHEAQQQPWPEWAVEVVKVVRKRSGYDGYDDASDGVDLPSELDEALSELEAEADRWKARAEAAEKRLEEAAKVIAPFAAGPVWSHLDDDAQLTSGAMHGIRITVRHLRAARDWQEAK